jgi:hypothetical protein
MLSEEEKETTIAKLKETNELIKNCIELGRLFSSLFPPESGITIPIPLEFLDLDSLKKDEQRTIDDLLSCPQIKELMKEFFENTNTLLDSPFISKEVREKVKSTYGVFYKLVKE